MPPRNKVKLDYSHPYEKLKRQYQKDETRSLLAKHPRNSALLISFIYLFAPLLLVVTNTSPSFFKAPADFKIENNILDGRGGPEEVVLEDRKPVERFSSLIETNNFNLDLYTPVSLESLVTVTKVINHLKVSETVMPTLSAETTSEYGWRTPPCEGCSADHRGVDFVPGYGTPIFAVADGMVVEMGRNSGYGNYIKLQHLMANSEGIIEDWITLYAHIKDNSFPDDLKIGSVVKMGQTIAAVGNTGMSTGPHLHFELIINGENVDPLPLLGKYKIIIVTEEDYPDYMFMGELYKKIEIVVRYE